VKPLTGPPTTSQVPAPGPGQLLDGRYKLDSELARGGMGRVFAGVDTVLQRKVAIKLIASPSPGELALFRFRQEARALAALNHPNILSIYDVGEYGGHPYLVFELLEGSTLREKLTRGPPALAEALDFALQMASGIAAAHERGIIHRDLKPDNVFVTGDGRVKMLDFGIAKLVAGAGFDTLTNAPGGDVQPEEEDPKTPKTAEGRAVGTTGYMAPEQIGGATIDDRADLFSFGTVLYELVAGRRAFTGSSPQQISFAIMRSKPPPLGPRIPAPVQRVIERCLEKDPAHRFQSAHELIRQLETAVTSLPRDRKRGSRNLRLAIAALATALVVASVVAAIVWRRAGRNGGSPSVLVLPPQVGPGAEDAAAAVVLGSAFEQALAPMSDTIRLRRASGDADGENQRQLATWVLGGRVLRTGSVLSLVAQFETPDGRRMGEAVEAAGTAEELRQRSGQLSARIQDELIPLWRDHLRRERAHQFAHDPAAADRLEEYYDLMGPSQRLEFLDRGRRLLGAALAADEAYVPALSERALLLRLAAIRDAEVKAEYLRLARADADAAVKLSPKDPQALLAECLVVRSQMRAYPSDRELEGATMACSHAAQADSRSVQALYALSQLYDQGCWDDQLVDALKLALERARRFDRSREGSVMFYLVSVALQRNHLEEADTFSSQLLAHEASEERLGTAAPSRRAGLPPLQGAHLLRAAILRRLGRDDDAQAQLEEELSRGAAAVGGLNEAVEAASLRGLTRLAARKQRAFGPARASRLAALEWKFEATELTQAGPSGLVGWYGFIDPEAAVSLIERRRAQQSCGAAIQHATIFRDAGYPKRAAQALQSCAPNEEWAKRCVRLVSLQLPSPR
jgi:Protein kinase domain